MTKDLIEGFEADEGASHLLHSLRDLIQNARQKALRAGDVVQVQTCWEIGRHIIEFEQGGSARAEYGVRLLQTLASSLASEFGRGFDVSNLRYMRLFYKAFPIRDALRHELSWTHYRTPRVEGELSPGTLPPRSQTFGNCDVIYQNSHGCASFEFNGP